MCTHIPSLLNLPQHLHPSPLSHHIKKILSLFVFFLNENRQYNIHSKKYMYIYTQRKPLHYTKHCARRCGHERRNSNLLWFYPWYQRRSGRKLKDHNMAENERVPQFSVSATGLTKESSIWESRDILLHPTPPHPKCLTLENELFLFLRTKL